MSGVVNVAFYIGGGECRGGECRTIIITYNDCKDNAMVTHRLEEVTPGKMLRVILTTFAVSE